MWVKCAQNKMASSVMEPHSNLCQLSAEIAVWFHHSHCLFHCFFMPVTTGQHPYMQLVSVLCKPVSSIPTSLSFLKFISLFQSFFQLNNSAPT